MAVEWVEEAHAVEVNATCAWQSCAVVRVQLRMALYEEHKPLLTALCPMCQRPLAILGIRRTDEREDHDV